MCTFQDVKSTQETAGSGLNRLYKYRLFNVLCWLWNIYEGAELPSVYFITNTKHCITYLALTQLFPVLISHPEMYTLCSILLHYVLESLISILAMDAFTWDKWILLAAFL